MVDSRAEVKSFNKSNLKNVQTVEKNTLPDAGSKSRLILYPLATDFFSKTWMIVIPSKVCLIIVWLIK